MLTREILKTISGFSGILPIVFFLVFYKRNNERKLWVIFVYVLLSFITDFLLGSVPKNSPEKFYIFSLFTAIEYGLFSAFLYMNLKSKKLRTFVVAAAPLFYGLVIYFFFHHNQTNDFDAIPASLESMLVIIFCVCFFFEQIMDMEVSFIYSSKTFWIVVALLVYMSAVFFLFISSEFFTTEERKAYWFINFISNIIKHILLASAFIMPNQKPKPTDQDLSYDELFQKPAL